MESVTQRGRQTRIVEAVLAMAGADADLALLKFSRTKSGS
jgi:hypothetical protein